MPQLGERDLALLSSIIYCDEFVKRNGANLQEIVTEMMKPGYVWEGLEFCGDFKHIEDTIGGKLGRETAVERFKQVLEEVQNSPGLQNIQIVNPQQGSGKSGITAACFVDKTDGAASVAFRGTDGSYKAWMDNFEGAGDSKATPMQKAVKSYMDKLPEKYTNITVTGHSKGGNLAAFATLVSDKVGRCVSYDGQGFSESFRNRFKDEIAANRKKIKTIAAYNDFVNIIMGSISGETVFVRNNLEVTGTFLEGHYITNLIFDNTFDENGDFTSFCEQDPLIAGAKWFLDTVLKYIPEYYEESFTDTFLLGLLALVFGKDKRGFDDFVDFALRLVDGVVLNPLRFYTTVCVVLAAIVLAVIEFAAYKTGEWIVEGIMKIVNKIAEAASAIGEWAEKIANDIREAAVAFCKGLSDWWNKNFNKGYQYAVSNPQVVVDTYKMNTYAQRLESVNNRLGGLDSRLNALYGQVGLFDLWDLLKADYKVGRSDRISSAAGYLRETATAFARVEKSITSKL